MKTVIVVTALWGAVLVAASVPEPWAIQKGSGAHRGRIEVGLWDEQVRVLRRQAGALTILCAVAFVWLLLRDGC